VTLSARINTASISVAESPAKFPGSATSVDHVVPLPRVYCVCTSPSTLVLSGSGSG